MELPVLRPSRAVAIPLAADATPRARQRILRKIPLTHTLARSLSHSLAHSLTLSRTHHFSLTVSLTLSLCSLRTLASLMLSAQQVVTSMSTPRWRQECRRAEDRSKLPEAGVQEAGGRRQECRRQECRRQERRVRVRGQTERRGALAIFFEVRQFSGELWRRGCRKQVRRPASKPLVHDS
jgi:hypothetical protein